MSLNRADRLNLLGLLGLVALLTVLPSAFAADSPTEPAPAEAGEQLFTPAPQPMGDCITCVGSYTTSTGWASGSTCSEAESNLDSQLRTEAFNTCQGLGLRGACSFQLVITRECLYDSCENHYTVEGYGIHGCLEGDIFCQY